MSLAFLSFLPLSHWQITERTIITEIKIRADIFLFLYFFCCLQVFQETSQLRNVWQTSLDVLEQL